MFKPNFIRPAALAVLLAFGSAGAAHAGGGGIVGATEPTQIMNNLELIKVAYDGAVTAKNTVQQYRTQLEQFSLDQANIKGLAGLPAALGADALKAYQDLGRYQQAVSSLEGSLSQQSALIERRIMEAKLSGRGWAGYVSDIEADAAANKTRAIDRLKHEESVLSQVRSDYEFARTMQAEIPASIGQHQSLQMLNSQMNRVITQNAKLTEVVSTTIRRQAQEDAQKAESATRTLAIQEGMRQRQNAIEARQRAFGKLQ